MKPTEVTFISTELEYESPSPTAAGACVSGRIIALYIVSACHFASVFFLLLDISKSSKLFMLGHGKLNSFDASLISFDFIVMALLLGWSGIQLYIAYKLNSGNSLKACVLCWVVLLVEAAFILVFIYGLFGSAPTNGNPFKAAGGIILTTIVLWQFVYTVLVTSFLGGQFHAYGCGPDSCCVARTGYQNIV